MQAHVANRPVLIVLLDAQGKLTRFGDANRIKQWMEGSQVVRQSIEVEEAPIPIREEVRGFCEILGLDPLFLANEGKDGD